MIKVTKMIKDNKKRAENRIKRLMTKYLYNFDKIGCGYVKEQLFELRTGVHTLFDLSFKDLYIQQTACIKMIIVNQNKNNSYFLFTPIFTNYKNSHVYVLRNSQFNFIVPPENMLLRDIQNENYFLNLCTPKPIDYAVLEVI